MVYEIEKEVKSNEFINFKHVKDYFNSYYIEQIYKKNESDKKEEAIRAQNEFKKILEYLPKEFDSVLSQWQNSGHLKKYFWIKMKYKNCGKLPSSISIFSDKLGFKVVIESDFNNNNYKNHNRYLDELKKNKKDLKDMIYFPLLGGELKNLSSITNIDADLKKVSDGEYDTLQAGYFKSYGDLNKEFNTLDKVPLTDIIIWIYKCINILLPYYEKCIEGAKENIVESEVTSDILATNIQIKEEYTPLGYFENINFNGDFKIENLYYEDKGLLEKQISKALKNGKHIILTGPPGTGKSKLAKEICNYYKANYKMTTALADWSTYDTIGGYSSSKDGSLYFQPGIFLSCFKDSKTNKKNEWLIIDEMNRADIDKAFGVFFSALTGDSVDLSFKGNNNENIKIFNEKDKKETNLENEYIIPIDFRLIGTINSFDKTSLFEMSYAFMRRFAFIPVTVPKNINSELIEKYLNIWNISKEDWLLNGLSELWKIINKYRKIGPAILEDIARYLESEEDFSSAITLYVLPQFEGLDEEGFQQFIKDILNINIIKDKSIIISFLEDFFGYIYKE